MDADPLDSEPVTPPDDPTTPDDAATPDEAATSRAKAELREALGHVRSAAGILLARAVRDPALKQASAEASRVLAKLGATAEPLARQLGVEAGRAMERVGAGAEQVARQVASEAERLGAELEAGAEPVAEQLAGELSRFTKKMAEVVQDGIDVTRELLDRDRGQGPKGCAGGWSARRRSRRAGGAYDRDAE